MRNNPFIYNILRIHLCMHTFPHFTLKNKCIIFVLNGVDKGGRDPPRGPICETRSKGDPNSTLPGNRHMNTQNVAISLCLYVMSNWGLMYQKWWDNSKYGLRIQIGQHVTPFWTKKKNITKKDNSRFSQNTIFSTVFCQKWGQMLSNFNFDPRFGILSSFLIN